MAHAVGTIVNALTHHTIACLSDGSEIALGVPLCECCDNEVDFDTQYCRSCEEVVEPTIYDLDDDGCVISRTKTEIETANIVECTRRDAFMRGMTHPIARLGYLQTQETALVQAIAQPTIPWMVCTAHIRERHCQDLVTVRERIGEIHRQMDETR